MKNPIIDRLEELASDLELDASFGVSEIPFSARAAAEAAAKLREAIALLQPNPATEPDYISPDEASRINSLEMWGHQ